MTSINLQKEEITILLSKYDVYYWENNLNELLEKAFEKKLFNVVKLLVDKGAKLTGTITLCQDYKNNENYIEMLKCVVPRIDDINKKSKIYPYNTILHTAMFFET